MIKMSASELLDFMSVRFFTTEEAIQMTGADAFSMRNWMKREPGAFGEKQASGRWMFSVMDMIQISSRVDLNEIGVPPAQSNEVCRKAVEFAKMFVEKSKSNRDDPDWDGYSALSAPLDQYVIISTFHNGKVRNSLAFWSEDGLIFSLDDELNETAQARRKVSHVQLAAGLIIEDVIEKAVSAYEQRLER